MNNHTFSGTERLYENRFINNQYREIPPDLISDYKKYREQKNEQAKKQKKIETARQLNLTQAIPRPRPPVVNPGLEHRQLLPSKTEYVEMKRKVFIDTKHRDIVLYPEPSDFVISWGKVFQNVKNMKLVSLEFPNVMQAVSALNNGLYHQNREDDDLDFPFPVYSTYCTPGSYNLTTIQTELTAQLKTNRRRGGQLDADGNLPLRHLFIVDVSQETDKISFTSIVPQNTPTNPITTSSGTTRIVFQQPDHGYKTGERVHIIGVQGIMGGLQGNDINGSYLVTKLSENSFSFEITTVAQGTATGGGSLIRTGRESPFQFLFGTHHNVIADILGFPVENSSETISNTDPITSNIKIITGCIPEPNQTIIIAPEHKLQVGDRVYLHNFEVTPSVYENEIYKGTFTISQVPSPDTFTIPYVIEHISDIDDAYVGTQTFSMFFPFHGFNRIVGIEQVGPNLVQITTLLDHYFDEKSTVRITGSDSVPSIDGFFHVQPLDSDTFTISSTDLDNPVVVSTPGHQGLMTTDHTFYLYNVQPFGGFTTAELNNVPFQVREIIDDFTFTFTGHYGFSSRAETGGGTPRINSKLHGWRGTQSNYFDDKLYKPIKLSGDNYCFMCIPGLNSDSISSSGPVRDIFAKIFISSVPGVTIFNEFDSSLIDFAVPIKSISELRFLIKDGNNQLLNFGNLDFSFGFELCEMVQVIK